MKRELTTVGEVGLRLTSAPGSSLKDTTCFETDVVGAEANVAADLAQLGRSVGLVTALPNTLLGERVVVSMQAYGVDTSRIVRMEDARVSLYYWERSEVGNARDSVRSVLCDRGNSAFARLAPAQIDWDYLLDTQWLHVTGIAAAISSTAHAVVAQAVKAAHAAGVSVSLDISHRAAQWPAQEAESALAPLLGSVDLLHCSSRDARTVFGLDGPDDELLERIAAITSADHVVMPSDDGGLYALAGSQRFHQGRGEVVEVDRAGARDALVAGVLHGLLKQDFARGLAYGAALATLALSRRGAQVVVRAEELDRLAEQAGPRMLDPQT